MTHSRQIRLTRPQTDETEIAEIREVLASGHLTQGPKVEEFERLVREHVGSTHTFAVTSATTALHLTLAAMEIGPGDEVLVADFTFPASANVVVQQGAVPVLVDIDLATYGMNVEDLERRITPRSRAIMTVHPFGLPSAMGPILDVAERHQLPVVEDAACALGATYAGRQAGSMGLAGCFSFHPRKSITTGEGGMIATSNDDLAERIRLLRSHGGVREQGRFRFEAAGYNYRLSDILAAVGVAQMGKLDALLAGRRRVAAAYDALLSNVAGLRTPVTPAGSTHTYQSYVVLLDREIDRDRVIAELRAEEIETTLGTYALHAQPFFVRAYGHVPGELPSSHRAFLSSLALPLHGAMADDDVAFVVERLVSALGGARRAAGS